MAKALFRFYEELNDFLPSRCRKKEFERHFQGTPTIKDQIESMGIPHTEIDLILINGDSVDFDVRLSDGDRVSVYPVFETLDISSVTRLRKKPLRTIKFICDVHLGRLVGYLRLLGFDTFYSNDMDDPELARISSEQERILLTKDRGLLKRKSVTHGYLVRSEKPREQLVEVIQRFNLKDNLSPFGRCCRCNGLIDRVDKIEIDEQLQEMTKKDFNEFYRCSGCGQVYWKGSHYKNLMLWLDKIL